jgi:hypothetical protein
MKLVKLFLLCGLSAAIFSSCIDDQPVDDSWKVANEAAFEAWKDSANTVLVEVPANRGGGSFLYRPDRIVETGRSPRFNDSIHVHYKGQYYTGLVFDKTYAGSEPDEYELDKFAKFRVSSLIRGWQEALYLMKEGEKWTIIVPQELGYGITASSIPAYTTLIFEVELLKVIPR